MRITPIAWPLLTLLAACFATEPRLPPPDPPPNVPPGLVLLELPERAVEALARRNVVDELNQALLDAQFESGPGMMSPETQEHVMRHRVVSGMTVREVVFCFRAHPRRERIQGPPGGRTLLWETEGLFPQRFWVRFDESGRAVDAGRY